MTDHPTHRTDAARQSTIGDMIASNLPLQSLARPQALLAHVSLFLSATAGLALLNLALDPAALWGRAVMIVWLVLLAGHAVGILILRLLTDDASTSPSWRMPLASRSATDSAWPAHAAHPAQPATASDRTEAPVASTDGWGPAPPTDPEPVDLSWPVASDTDTVSPPASPPATNGEDRVPWRAATEIAWLRNRRETRSDEPRPGRAATETREPEA